MDERSLALLVLATSIVVGLAYPPLARVLAPAALVGLFFVVIFSLVPFATLPLRQLVSLDQRIGRVVLWQQIVLPSVVVALGILLKLPVSVISLLIVTTCSGALFAAPALAALLDLDRREALQCMVLTTLSMPVSMFVFLTVVVGGHIQLDLWTYGIRVLIFLALPFLVFLLYRPVAAAMSEPMRANAEWLSRWAVVGALAVFGIGMMARVTSHLTRNPGEVAFYLVLTTVVCIFMLTVTTIVMHRYGSSSAMTAAILTGFRNVGLGYALIGEMIGPELAVYTGVGLLPVFTAPAILKMIASRRQAYAPDAT